MIELQNKSPKILVIGDLMIDHYLWGSCDLILKPWMRLLLSVWN